MAFSRPQNGRDAFALKAKAYLEKALRDQTYEYDADSFRLVPSDPGRPALNLAPSFEFYVAAPVWKRSGVLRNRLDAVVEMLQAKWPTADEVRPKLRPKIRNRIDIESRRFRAEMLGESGTRFPFRVLGEHLTLEVAVDQGSSIASVNQQNLDEWGMTFDEALDIGNQNLLRTGTHRFQDTRTGVFISKWQDSYDCSRLHLPEIIDSVRVKGRPVAMAPNWDVLMITGSEDEQGLVEMARIARTMIERPDRLSGFAFCLTNAWLSFLPSADHPAFAHLKELHTKALGSCYAQQAEDLLAYNETRGIDQDIPVPMIIRPENAALPVSSATGWAQGVVSLLPKTDHIAFSVRRADGKFDYRGIVEWEQAELAFGRLLQRQDTYPVRYLVEQFPTADQLASLPWRPRSPKV